jgi:hypothetical protein
MRGARAHPCEFQPRPRQRADGGAVDRLPTGRRTAGPL